MEDIADCCNAGMGVMAPPIIEEMLVGCRATAEALAKGIVDLGCVFGVGLGTTMTLELGGGFEIGSGVEVVVGLGFEAGALLTLIVVVRYWAGTWNKGSPGKLAVQLGGISCPVKMSAMRLGRSVDGQLGIGTSISVTGSPYHFGNTMSVSTFLEIKVNGQVTVGQDKLTYTPIVTGTQLVLPFAVENVLYDKASIWADIVIC